MIEKKSRSAIKTISWRFTATIITIVLVYIFTGKQKISIGVGLVEVITKTVFYYVHERMWVRISRGKINK